MKAKPKMRFRYAVTFEDLTGCPDTVRGEIDVANGALGVRRAYEAAKKACPNRRWASATVLLEHAGRPEGAV